MVAVSSVYLAIGHQLISPITITMVVLIVKTVTVNNLVRNVLRVAELFHEVLTKHLLVDFYQDSFCINIVKLINTWP